MIVFSHERQTRHSRDGHQAVITLDTHLNSIHNLPYYTLN